MTLVAAVAGEAEISGAALATAGLAPPLAPRRAIAAASASAAPAPMIFDAAPRPGGLAVAALVGLVLGGCPPPGLPSGSVSAFAEIRRSAGERDEDGREVAGSERGV